MLCYGNRSKLTQWFQWDSSNRSECFTIIHRHITIHFFSLLLSARSKKSPSFQRNRVGSRLKSCDQTQLLRILSNQVFYHDKPSWSSLLPVLDGIQPLFIRLNPNSVCEGILKMLWLHNRCSINASFLLPYPYSTLSVFRKTCISKQDSPKPHQNDKNLNRQDSCWPECEATGTLIYHWWNVT